MKAVADFLAMGGYAAFVWPAYAIALAVLGGLTVQSWRRYRSAGTLLAGLQGKGG